MLAPQALSERSTLRLTIAPAAMTTKRFTSCCAIRRSISIILFALAVSSPSMRVVAFVMPLFVGYADRLRPSATTLSLPGR